MSTSIHRQKIQDLNLVESVINILFSKNIINVIYNSCFKIKSSFLSNILQFNIYISFYSYLYAYIHYNYFFRFFIFLSR